MNKIKSFLKNITIVEVGVGALAVVGAIALGRALGAAVNNVEASTIAEAAVDSIG